VAIVATFELGMIGPGRTGANRSAMRFEFEGDPAAGER